MTSTLRPSPAPATLPEPKGYPFIGHALDYRLNPLSFYAHCAEYGDFVRLRFGPHPVYFLNHPDLIKEVFVTQGSCFLSRAEGRESRLFDPLFGQGLAVSEGSFWRRQRRLVQPLFQRQHLADYGDIAVNLTQEAMASWPTAESLSVRDLMLGVTRKIVTRITLGEPGLAQFHLVEAVLNAALTEYEKRDQNWFRYLLPEHFPTASNRRYRQAAQELDACLYALIAQQRQAGVSDGSMLGQLLQARDDQGEGMSDQEIRDELVNVVIGHDTLADVFNWAWWLIAQNPQVEAELLDEWQRVLGGRMPTMADIPQLTYTEAVITETLRLYPLAWVTGRVATQDCEIGGHPIHAGENVVMCQWVTHRDSRFFENPNQFQPERWSSNRAKAIPNHAYFPFGGGARICIGRGLTMMETILLLATIGQRFQIQPLSHQQVVPQPGPSFSLRAKPGLKMQIIPR